MTPPPSELFRKFIRIGVVRHPIGHKQTNASYLTHFTNGIIRYRYERKIQYNTNFSNSVAFPDLLPKVGVGQKQLRWFGFESTNTSPRQLY